MTSKILGATLLLFACERLATTESDKLAASAVSSVGKPAASAEPVELRANRYLGVIEELSRLHAKHAKDCGALAPALAAFREARRRDLEVRDDVQAQIEANEPLAKRMHQAMEVVMTVSMECKGALGPPKPLPSRQP